MTPLPGPLVLLGLPLVAAGLTYLVRRWALLAALAAALTTAALAVLCLRLPLDRSAFVLGQEVAFGRPVVLIGRTLQLDAAGQAWLALVFALAAVLYLLAWRLQQGRMFFSVSLVILSQYVLIVLLQTFSLAVLVLAMAAAVAVFMIQGERPGSVRGAQRYLLVTFLAVPLLLAAGWLTTQALLDPQNAQAARQALLPAALGFALFLAVFPFGTWMPALAADAPPLVTAFLFTAGQAMAIFLALTFVRTVPGTLDSQTARDVLQVAGLVTAVSAGVIAAVQRDLGRTFGYAALSDLGYLLLAAGLGGSQGASLGLLHMVNRSTAIVLIAAALAVVRQYGGSDAFSELAGTARSLPIAAGGLVLGGLALAGLPFTAGFPTHWAIGRAIAAQQEPWALLLLLSSAGIALGFVRALSHMLGPSPSEPGPRQPAIASAMVLLLGLLVIVVGLRPQLLLGPIRAAVEALLIF